MRARGGHGLSSARTEGRRSYAVTGRRYAKPSCRRLIQAPLCRTAAPAYFPRPLAPKGIGTAATLRLTPTT